MEECGGKDFCEMDFKALDFVARDDIMPNLTLFTSVQCSSNTDQLLYQNLMGFLTAGIGVIMAAWLWARLTYKRTKLSLSDEARYLNDASVEMYSVKCKIPDWFWKQA